MLDSVQSELDTSTGKTHLSESPPAAICSSNQSLIQVSTSDPHKRTLIITLLIANTHTRNTFGVNY
jgi:hypothetical protein